MSKITYGMLYSGQLDYRRYFVHLISQLFDNSKTIDKGFLNFNSCKIIQHGDLDIYMSMYEYLDTIPIIYMCKLRRKNY